MGVADAFITLAFSLGLGLLVGMQREHVQTELAGIRTFALITLLGTITAMIPAPVGPWLIGAAALGVIAAIIIGDISIIRGRRSEEGLGITTEIAILAMFADGVLLVHGPREVAVAVGVVVAILLWAKAFLHDVVRRLGNEDVRAIMQFALITFIILPVLPNQTYGPYDVLNPRQIWLMVVLVVGISLGGYITYKFLGERAGTVLGGLLGGLISSTATTVSFSRRATADSRHVAAAALVLMLATAVMFVRVLVEIAVVAPTHWTSLVFPIIAMLIVCAGLSVVAWRMSRHTEAKLLAQDNPTELKSALFFAAIYAIVLLAVAAANEHLRQEGLYAVAAISGLTDMDAITLSTSRMLNEQRIEAPLAWRAIVIAAMSNLVFKAGIVALLGSRALLGRIAALFGVLAAAGALLLIFWPG